MVSPLAGQGTPQLETTDVWISVYLDRLLKGTCSYRCFLCRFSAATAVHAPANVARSLAGSQPVHAPVLQWTTGSTVTAAFTCGCPWKPCLPSFLAPGIEARQSCCLPCQPPTSLPSPCTPTHRFYLTWQDSTAWETVQNATAAWRAGERACERPCTDWGAVAWCVGRGPVGALRHIRRVRLDAPLPALSLHTPCCGPPHPPPPSSPPHCPQLRRHLPAIDHLPQRVCLPPGPPPGLQNLRDGAAQRHRHVVDDGPGAGLALCALCENCRLSCRAAVRHGCHTLRWRAGTLAVHLGVAGFHSSLSTIAHPPFLPVAQGEFFQVRWAPHSLVSGGGAGAALGLRSSAFSAPRPHPSVAPS